jgi:hypothetical protein
MKHELSLSSCAMMLSCYFLLFTGFVPDAMAQMFSTNGNTFFDIAIRHQQTGQRARMIVRGGSIESGTAVQRCIQFNFEPTMKCRIFFNGKAGPEYPSPAPPIGQGPIFTPGPKTNMRGRGRWRGWEIIGSFQYSQPSVPFTGGGFPNTRNR